MLLLLDNKDSFVWNLAQAFGVLGEQVEVVRSDEATTEQIEAADAIVISPGPGRPDEAGRSLEVVREWSGRIPMLGVCLGHQTIAQAFGAEIVRGEPMHGRPSPIHHDGTDLFEGLPQPMSACRYHSLYVPHEMPSKLLATAHTEAGEVMALRHRTHATFGVQFHPESFRTESGSALLRNFLRLATPTS
ncbi:MAG: aminodeoxychorismate/anthranilate synthase component II [Planctomycetota bacterium]